MLDLASQHDLLIIEDDYEFEMNFLDHHLLSLVIWLPIVGGVLVLLISGSQRPTAARWSSLVVSILTFSVSLSLWTGFDRSSSDMQFVERQPWIDLRSLKSQPSSDLRA